MAHPKKLAANVRAVIFDMDGVLVDSEPLYEQHLTVFLTKLGADGDPAGLPFALKAQRAQETAARLIQHLDLDFGVEEMVVMMRDHYIKHLSSLESIPAIPGAVQLVKKLHESGYKLAVASSASPRRIEFFLTKLGLKKYFHAVVSADDVARSKPHPDAFLLAAKKLDVEPSACLVIEDAAKGVQAAKAAGMQCAGYTGSGYNTDDLSAADLIVRDLNALTSLL